MGAKQDDRKPVSDLPKAAQFGSVRLPAGCACEAPLGSFSERDPVAAAALRADTSSFRTGKNGVRPEINGASEPAAQNITFRITPRPADKKA